MAGLVASGVSTTSGCGDSAEAGNAGTTGNAGTGGGSAGTGGGGGGSACAAPAAALITDFSAAGAVGTPYTFQDANLTAPTTSTASGALVITVNSGMPTTQYPYLGVGLPFNACVNASTYTGVKFNISGTLTAGCTIQFSLVDKNHSTVTNNGTCETAENCYPAAKVFSLPATATDVTVLFTEQSGGVGHAGALTFDPTVILNAQWQISPVGGDAGSACSGTVTIDNVTFI